jgi:hydrogenase maturation protease
VRKIVCIGNRYREEDTFGPLVHDALTIREIPGDIELIDGGLAGLDLLRVFDNAEAVVFVDAARGLDRRHWPILLSVEQASAPAGERFDHAAGLPYLLRAMRETCAGSPPVVHVIACEGEPIDGAVEAAADMCLRLLKEDGAAHRSLERMSVGSPE